MHVHMKPSIIAKIQLGAIGLLGLSISSLFTNETILVPIAIGIGGLFLNSYAWFATLVPVIKVTEKTIVISEPFKRRLEVDLDEGYSVSVTEQLIFVKNTERTVCQLSTASYEAIA